MYDSENDPEAFVHVEPDLDDHSREYKSLDEYCAEWIESQRVTLLDRRSPTSRRTVRQMTDGIGRGRRLSDTRQEVKHAGR